MNSKTCLFNHTKDFIYSQQLEDLNIFSKEYLNCVLKPYYSSNSENTNYVAICIDFNKLNDINNTYGYQTGNKVIHHCLSLIQSVLPPNTIYVRSGGDEFVFIIENCSPENIEPLINKMDIILKEHEKELLFCNITSSGIHSSEKNSLSEMISEADTRITAQKNNFNQNYSYSQWEILEKKISQNLISFFKSLRLYKKTVTVDFFKSLYKHTISSCCDLLEKDFTKENPKYVKKDSTPSFDRNELDKLYSIFLNKTPTNDEITSISENTYSSLLNNLILNHVNGNFSKGYFLKYLLKDCNQEFQVKYISSSFIKLYNTVFSHNATDIKLDEMVDDFTNYLQEELGITLSNESFLKEPQNYFISLGAGDYLLALQQSDETINSKINNYFSSIKQDTSKVENLLRLFCSKDFHTITSENFDTLLAELSNECKESKDDYKISILDEPMIKDCLNNIIYDSTQYYIDTIPDSNDINNKNRFLHLLANSMLNTSITLNKEQEKNNEGR